MMMTQCEPDNGDNDNVDIHRRPEDRARMIGEGSVATADVKRDPAELAAQVLRRIESYLQMMWVQHEWITDEALERIEAPLRRVVDAYRSEIDPLSTGDVLRRLEQQLTGYFEHCVVEGRWIDDASMKPVIERFAGSLLESGFAGRG